MSVITATPSQVLGYHADLVNRHRNPDRRLVSYLYHYMTSVARQGGVQEVQALFYPAVPDSDLRLAPQHAADAAKMIGRELADAATYQVTVEMIDAMRGVYGNMEEVESLDVAELPCESGWAWFDKSWPIRDVNGDYYHLRAISWCFLTARVRRGQQVFGDGKECPCTRISLWVHVADDLPDVVDSAIGQVQLIHTAVIPFGVPFLTSERDKKAESFLGVTHLLWMFLGMEITATTRPRIQNHYRKHALRSLKHGEVHVVMLRRVRYHSDAPEVHRKIDWQARWVVQGHWRHLSNPNAEAGKPVHRAVAISDGVDRICAVCGGKLTWVHPYIKGPDGLSLKVSKTLHRLAR
jgi:hypothetical protein